jgi:tetratricopeptide (TPR) repeat protein
MYFNKAKAINPKYKDNTWNKKGYNLTIPEKYKQAIECYDYSLEIDSDAHTWKNKGECLSKLGREKAAQECFDKAKILDILNMKSLLVPSNMELLLLVSPISSTELIISIIHSI